MGLLNQGGTRLTVFVINRHIQEPIEAEVLLEGFETARVVQVKTLTGESFMSRNEWNVRKVELIDKEILMRDGHMDHQFPPISLTRFTFFTK
jgi:alpha-L-arabinofuranosidase